MKLQKGNAHENNSRCDNFPNSPIREQTCLPGENSPSNNGQPYKLLRYMKYRHWTTDIPQSSYPLKKNCQNYEEIDDKLEAKTSLYFPIGGYEKGDPPNRNILTQLCTYFLSLLTVWTRICEFLYSDRLPPPRWNSLWLCFCGPHYHNGGWHRQEISKNSIFYQTSFF